MFELIAISILSAAYIGARIEESKQAKIDEEKERLMDLKIKFFCYAIRHGLLYDEVVDKLKNNEIFGEDIAK